MIAVVVDGYFVCGLAVVADFAFFGGYLCYVDNVAVDVSGDFVLNPFFGGDFLVLAGYRNRFEV